MRAIKLEAQVTKERRLVVDLPDDVIEGPAEIIVLLRGPQVVPGTGDLLSDPEAWLREFDTWVASHDPNTPVPPAEALRRDALYDDRW